jgi:hypothetical protein
LIARRTPMRRTAIKRMRTKPVRKMSAKRRKEAPLIKAVRAECVERDGYCRLAGLFVTCHGESAWCHLEGKRRSQTRNMKPEDRHSAAWTVMLCARHAELEERHVLRSRYDDPARGAHGLIRWTFDQRLEAAA